MKNLTSLLKFIQDKHVQIHSVTFKNYIYNHVLCEITFKGNLDKGLLGLINLFIAEFGAKLSLDFAVDNVKIYVISELNKFNV